MKCYANVNRKDGEKPTRLQLVPVGSMNSEKNYYSFPNRPGSITRLPTGVSHCLYNWVNRRAI